LNHSNKRPTKTSPELTRVLPKLALQMKVKVKCERYNGTPSRYTAANSPSFCGPQI